MALTRLSLQWGAAFSTGSNTNLVGYSQQGTAWVHSDRSVRARATGAPGPMDPRLRCCCRPSPSSTPHAGVAESPSLVTGRWVAVNGHLTAPRVDRHNDPLRSFVASTCATAVQREETVAAGGRTHGKRRQADVRFGSRRWPANPQGRRYQVEQAASLVAGGLAADAYGRRTRLERPAVPSSSLTS